MKRAVFLLLLTAIMIISGSALPPKANPQGWITDIIDVESGIEVLPAWVMPESMKPSSKPNCPQGSNSNIIDFLTLRMQKNKKTNSVEGLTKESTFIDAVESIGQGSIDGAFLTYNCELAGYPAIVKYCFGNNSDGMVSLYSMVFYVVPDQRIGFEKQLKEFVAAFEDVLGSHTHEGEYPYYSYRGDAYSISIMPSKDFISSGVLASVIVVSSEEVNSTDIFPYRFGTDINTIYMQELPDPNLENITNDVWPYYLYYSNEDAFIGFSFSVEGADLKLRKAEYTIHLFDTGYEYVEKCLRTLGDNMETIFGPAASRNSKPSEHITFAELPPHKEYIPALVMNWPGLEIAASYFEDQYTINVYFTEEYFLSENK